MTSVPTTTNGLQTVQRVTTPPGDGAAASLPIAQIRPSAQLICTTCSAETLFRNSMPYIPGVINRQTLTELNFRPAMGATATTSVPEIWLRPSANSWLGFQFWTFPRAATADGLPPPHSSDDVENWLREQCANRAESCLPAIAAEHSELASAVARSGVPASRPLTAPQLQRFQFHPLPSDPTGDWHQRKLANNAYILWRAGSSLQDLSRLTPAEIPAPEPVSEPYGGAAPQPIQLEPNTPIFSLPFHLGHQFLHDTQLCATSQLHFVQTALTAMGLQTHADIALHEVTQELLADAGFARSNEDIGLWLKQQLERERYWVFHTGHPTMNELLTWYRHTYGSTPNYELAPTWMIFEAANDARRGMQQASAYSTTTTHTSYSSDHLLGPATRRLSLYESTDPLSARRPSFTSTSHYSTTR
ncbi:MAG: hypothetical protein ACRC9R_08130, partial [Enterovibrio sp.]